jgi:Cu/Ag efflux protein CusF
MLTTSKAKVKFSQSLNLSTCIAFFLSVLVEQRREAMRKFVIIIAAGTMVMGSSFAWAWSDVTGTIDKVNAKSHEVTLDNGQTYMFEKNVKMGALKKGEKVTLSWEEQKGKNMVNKVTMEENKKS